MKEFHPLGSFRKIVFSLVLAPILSYLFISFFFVHHYGFNTTIYGIDVSLKTQKEAETILKEQVPNYSLQCIERDGEMDEIKGQSIGLRFNEGCDLSQGWKRQHPLFWIRSVWSQRSYEIENLVTFDEGKLAYELSRLNCLLRTVVEPNNVGFEYANGSYRLIKEVEGNEIQVDQLEQAVKRCLQQGMQRLDLLEAGCYKTPKYRLDSPKTIDTLRLLNRYVSTRVSYQFGSDREVVDGSIIHAWLSVDEDLEVILDPTAVRKYCRYLSKRYDTVGITRLFKTSSGKVIEVKDGLYGWKLDQEAESKALQNHILLGDRVEKEPAYLQTAYGRGEEELGNTYVEISIAKQYLWFYKNGEIVAQGPVVTGNPKKGNQTVTGTYMLNYKQKGATLRGVDYASRVSYWMPFYGNIGIHDAPWRSSFGGKIYVRNGTHGCINAPYALAKALFEQIGEGVPIVIYDA